MLSSSSTLALAMGLLMVTSPAYAQGGPTSAAGSPSQSPDNGDESQSSSAPDGAAASGSAQADAGGQAGAGAGDIIVTAQRRSESLSRVGATITAVDAGAIVSQGIKTTADLTRAVPGLQATQSGASNPIYTLRGVGFSAPNEGATPPIGLYFDQAAIPYSYFTIGLLFDLARVEVLKGPQGTLYGRNATGGLINFVPAKPTSELAAGTTLEVGNYRTINVTGYVSGPLGSGFRGRLAFSSQNRNQGWQRSVTRDDRLGILHQNSLRGILDYDADGPFTASLTGNYWNRTGDTQAPQAIRATARTPNPLAVASAIPNPTSNTQADWPSVSRQTLAGVGIIRPDLLTDSTFYSVALKLGYRLSDGVRLESLSSYQHLRHRDVGNVSGLQIDAAVVDVSGRIRSVSQELRLIGESDKLNWSIGGYIADDHFVQRQIGYNSENSTVGSLRRAALGLNNGRYDPADIAVSFGNYDTQGSGGGSVASLFANGEYKLSDQIKLSAGVRYTKDKVDEVACTRDYRGRNLQVVNLYYGFVYNHVFNLQPGECYTLQGNTGQFVTGPVANKVSQQNVAWRANVDYTPTDNMLFYATVSRGYKAGSFPLIPASNSSQLSPVNQEQLTAYEVGSKMGLFDRKVQLNLSGFFYDYKDKQIFGRAPDLVFGTLFRILNVPRSEVYGAEADLTFRPLPYLNINLAAVYLHSRILEYSGFNDAAMFTNFRGHPFTLTPNFQGNALITLSPPITDDINLDASVSAHYQSRSTAAPDEAPDFRIDSYAVFGGTLGVRSADDRFSVGLYAQNIFNKYYWTQVLSATDSIYRFSGGPRQFGLRLGYRY